MEHQQQEDQPNRGRNGHSQAGIRLLHLLVLTGKFHGVAGRKINRRGDPFARFGDVASYIAIRNVDEDPTCEARVLRPDHWRPLRVRNSSQFTDRDVRASWCWNEDAVKITSVLTERTIVAQHDIVALAPLYRLGKGHPAECGLHDRLECCHVDFAPGEFSAVRLDFEILAAHDPVRKSGSGAGNIRCDLFDLAADRLDLIEIVSGYLDAQRCSNTGRDHVHPDLDRITPGVYETRHFKARIQFVRDVVNCDARPPIRLGLQPDPGFDHGEGGRIGCGICPPGLSEDPLDLWHCGDDPIGLAKDFAHLG